MDDLYSLMLEAEARKGTRGPEMRRMTGPMMDQAEEAYSLPRGLLDLMAHTESTHNPNAENRQGAKGLMQFRDDTSGPMGVDPYHPAESIWGSARYVSDLTKRFDGDLEQGLAAYNVGPTKLRRRGMDNLPRETQSYLQKILGELERRRTAYPENM